MLMFSFAGILLVVGAAVMYLLGGMSGAPDRPQQEAGRPRDPRTRPVKRPLVPVHPPPVCSDERSSRTPVDAASFRRA
jgi:hypothetical protein